MKTPGLPLLLLVTAACTSRVSKGKFNGFQSTLNASDEKLVISYTNDGQYTVSVNKKIWLTGAQSFFQVNGHRYSTGDGSLVLGGLVKISGTDAVGAWSGVRFEYLAGKTPIWTTMRAYMEVPAVVFGQEFPKGAQRTSLYRRNVTLSAFPNFKVGSSEEDIGYLAYGDKFVGDMKKTFGRWREPMLGLVDGIDGGPITLFDQARNAIFMTPFNSFMIASPYHDRNSSTYGWGIVGGILWLPPNFKMETILYYSPQGIRRAISGWGVAMRRMYKKDTSLRDTDFTNNYLSYWTDNGAYYVNYYVSNFLIQNMTYEEAVLGYMKYARALNIPFRTIQYSVWYQTYGGTFGGTTLWKANPRMLPKGMGYMRDYTGLASTSHNRWWSSKTPYPKQNGGNYDFIVEGRYALPQDEQFWTDMFALSQKWGIMNYMQDWLQLPMELMNATISDVNVAANWLNQMGLGASRNGISIQYCMSLSRHVLQSLMIPAVTQVRASDDYQPSDDYSYEQWRIGISSMFADAVGLAPFKDTFWTTSDQPGNFYKARDPYVELQALVASLSTGPVGPGDMINGTNRTLLMRCCNEDGLILKASRPPFPIDDQIKQSAFGGSIGPVGEVWTTYSQVGRYLFGIIFAAAMEDGNSIYAVGPTTANFGEKFLPSRLYSFRKHPAGNLPLFSDEHPVTVTSGCSRQTFCLFYTTPIFKFRGVEVLLLGELDKWVPMSPQRITNIEFSDEDFQVELCGASEETVYFSIIWYATYIQLTCRLSLAGKAVLRLPALSCL